MGLRKNELEIKTDAALEKLNTKRLIALLSRVRAIAHSSEDTTVVDYYERLKRILGKREHVGT